MAANIDLNRIPGKPGDPYRGQAVLHPEGPHKIKLPPIPVSMDILLRCVHT